MKILIGIIILISSSNTSFEQTITQAQMQSVRMVGPVDLHDSQKKQLGCDFNLECMDFHVVFYFVHYAKGDSTLQLEGRTYFSAHKAKQDTFTLNAVEIITGKPIGSKLTHIQHLGRSSEGASDSSRLQTFPNRRGDFKIRIKRKKNFNLYFVTPNFYVSAYDLGRLWKIVDR